MKMGVGTRIVFSIFIIIILGVCAGITLAAFGVFPAENVDRLISGFTDTGYKYIWAGAAIVLFAAGVILLFFGTKRVEPVSVLLLSSVDGSVSVSLDALRELAGRHLNEVSGIITQRIDIHPIGDRNVRVNLYLSVKPEVEIPVVTKTIADGVKGYIEKYSGINASYVSIKIQPIKNNQYPTR